MKKILYLAIVIAAFCVNAYAEEVGFKNLLMGSDISMMEKDTRYKCEKSTERAGDTICRLNEGAKETIADFPVDYIGLSYYSDKLCKISITFSSLGFTIVIPALNNKYGQGKVESVVGQDKMKKPVTNETIVWKKGDCTIKAEKYTYEFGSSAYETSKTTVSFKTDSAIKEDERRSKERSIQKQKTYNSDFLKLTERKGIARPFRNKGIS